MKKYALSTVATILLAASSSFAASINVLYTDGTCHYTDKTVVERIEIGDGKVTVVTSDGESRQHLVADIERIELNSTQSGVDAAADASVTVVVSRNSISISGSQALGDVALFDSAGRVVASAGARGASASLSTSHISEGVYILRVGKISQKILIK